MKPVLYHKVKKRTKLFEMEVLNFIPHTLDAEVMQITVKNVSKKKVIFTPTTFIPLYGRPEKCLRDHRHVSALLNRIEMTRHGILLAPTMVFDEAGHRSEGCRCGQKLYSRFPQSTFTRPGDRRSTESGA